MAKQNFSVIFILTALLHLLIFFSSSAVAAVVEGDQVVRYVDTPTGTILYQGTAIDTAPVPFENSSNEIPISQNSSGLSERPREKKVSPSSEMPEVPNFEAEVETPVQKHKSSNTFFIVIGAIVIIIGVGIILFIAKSREKE